VRSVGRVPEVSRTKSEALAALEDEYRKTLHAVQDFADEDFDVPRRKRHPRASSGSGVTRCRSRPIWTWTSSTPEPSLERKDWPLQRVMKDVRRSHEALVTVLERVSDEEFSRATTHKYRDGTLDGVVWFAFIYIEHYEEHRAQLA
jgi:hypothetical protein